MKHLLAVHALLQVLTYTTLIGITTTLAAQTEKSTTPIPTQNSKPNTQNSTRAVVVGISDYQDAAIPDLRFADRDAEAFADWLRSPAGGGVPEENIRLLINNKATVGQTAVALIDWLLESTMPGDRVIIYFSGHGEMESRLLNQLGYLLLWDSPAHVSIAGALPVDLLKQVVTTLSVERKANVMVIADACRAGKLASSSVIGAQLTNANLGRQFASEQKILSCQANEYSVEGEQWGGGRGAFSYHLVNGLYGLADLDNNEYITLLEIEHFIQDRVPTEVMPVSQIPFAVGDKNAVVARVDKELLRKVKQGEEVTLAPFSGLEQRGLIQETLAKADSSIITWFWAFQHALKEKRFLEPADDCAEKYYKLLLQQADVEPLHNYLRRNYAAALMDAGQQVVNRLMKTDPATIDNIWRRQANWDHIPEQMARAADLLGEKHYYYRILKAKEFYFRYITFSPKKHPGMPVDSIRVLLNHLVSTGLSFDSKAPYLLLRAARLGPIDSLFSYEKKLNESAPNWAFWHYSLGYTLANHVPLDTLNAFRLLSRSIELDSSFVEPFWALSFLLKDLGRPDEARQLEAKAIEVVYRKYDADPSSVMAFEWNLTGNLLWQQRRYRKAEKALLAGERKLGRADLIMSSNLHMVYFDMGEYDKVVSTLERFPEKMFIHWWFRSLGTLFYYYKNDPEKALSWYIKELNCPWFESMAPDYLEEASMLISILHRKTGEPSRSWETLKNLKITLSDVHLEKGEVLLLLGRNAEAAAEFDSLLLNLPLGTKQGKEGAHNLMLRIIALHRLGKTTELNDVLRDLQPESTTDPWLHFHLSAAYAQIRMPEKAMQHLLQAEEYGWQPEPAQWLFGTVKDPFLDPIRNLPEFQSWEKRWLPPYKDYSRR